MSIDWLLENWYVVDFDRSNAKKFKHGIYLSNDNILFKDDDVVGYRFPEKVELVYHAFKNFVFVKVGNVYIPFDYSKNLQPAFRSDGYIFGLIGDSGKWNLVKFGNKDLIKSEAFKCDCYNMPPYMDDVKYPMKVIADEKCVRNVYYFDPYKLKIINFKSILDCGIRNCYEVPLLGRLCD